VLRIWDVYPGSQILIFTNPGSQIPNPGSQISDPRSRIQQQQQQQLKRGVKKICCHTFFRSHKFYKIENYLIFEMLKKKIWANFQRIIELFTQKIVTILSKIWVWDWGSEIQDPKKTYSGSRIQGSKRHRIPDSNPRHWSLYLA
jgi:hypothetical protein